MKIVTWNINSIRIRLGNIDKLTKLWNPDIICLQETKVEDAYFPLADVAALGFEHIHISGQKSYNGVAFLSKVPIKNIITQDFASMGHMRHIAGELPDGTQLHNFYVPAGGDIPDPVANPAYAAKLRFVEEMTEWAKNNRHHQKMIAVGDFNIAPYEHDVWSHKQLLGVVSHTPPETERLAALRSSIDWVDSGRHFTPMEEKLYSWWSYRNRDWKKSNRGRRLDHIWVTPALAPKLNAYHTLVDARDWEGPSDHVPVAIDINIG